MYIVPGQGLTTSWGQNFMSTGTSCHFSHLLQVSKKSLRSLILYKFFHDFRHVYSPRVGADNPPGTKFWKIGQGQPRVIIWTNGSTRAPDAAYQVSRSSAFWFRRRKFFKVLPYMGMAAIVWTNFRSPIPWRLHMKFGFNRPSGFWRKVECGQRMEDRGLPIL